MTKVLWSAGVAALIGLGLQSAALAAPIASVTASPKYTSVVEGLPGVFDFTVTNDGSETFTVTDVRLFDKPIRFLTGDKHDEVWSTSLAMESNCKGKALGPGGTCTFQQTFQTRDKDKAHSGTNVGIWAIFNAVDVTTGVPGGFDERYGAARVEVRDPGAVSIIPVPPAFPFLGSALVTVALLVRKRTA